MRLFVIFGICLMTFLAFFSALDNDFINWDDPEHLTENVTVRSLRSANIARIFTTTINGTYIPLTTLSFAVEYCLFGNNPFVYHLTNVLLHLGVVTMVFFVARQLGANICAASFAALLFGVHPMRVESVVWITERKDMLYAIFYLLSVFFYGKYVLGRSWLAYMAALAFGLFSILAKPMALSLPLILFLYEWKLKRKFSSQVIWDKIPFIIMMALISWVTYSLNMRIPGRSVWEGTLIWLWTLTFYIKKFFLPFNLSPIYLLPYPVSLFHIEYGLAVFIMAILFLGALYLRKNKWFIFANLYYLLSIFFLLRYDDMMDRSLVADRFMYLPSLGYCFFLGVLFEKVIFQSKRKEKERLAALSCVVLLFCSLIVQTHVQCNVWQNSIVFWSSLIKRMPDVAYFYHDRGSAYSEKKMYKLALADFNKALALKPDFPEVYNNRGLIYWKTKKFNAALSDYNQALDLHLEDAELYNNRGRVFEQLRQDDLALKDYSRAISLEPMLVSAYRNRAFLYLSQNRFELALADFDKVLDLDPAHVQTYLSRGAVYASLGFNVQAEKDFCQVLLMDPGNEAATNNLKKIKML